jgi:hypothetical protein
MHHDRPVAVRDEMLAAICRASRTSFGTVTRPFEVSWVPSISSGHACAPSMPKQASHTRAGPAASAQLSPDPAVRHADCFRFVVTGFQHRRLGSTTPRRFPPAHGA